MYDSMLYQTIAIILIFYLIMKVMISGKRVATVYILIIIINIVKYISRSPKRTSFKL